MDLSRYQLTEKWRARRSLAAFLFVVLVGAYGLYAEHQNSDRDRENARRIDYTSCLTANDSRKTLADLISLTVTDAPPFDYSRVASFAAIDVTMQNFLKDLSTFNTTNSGSSREAMRKYANERLPQRDCNPLLDGKPAVNLPPK